jgi:hypothetical protein
MPRPRGHESAHRNIAAAVKQQQSQESILVAQKYMDQRAGPAATKPSAAAANTPAEDE